MAGLITMITKRTSYRNNHPLPFICFMIQKNLERSDKYVCSDLKVSDFLSFSEIGYRRSKA